MSDRWAVVISSSRLTYLHSDLRVPIEDQQSKAAEQIDGYGMPMHAVVNGRTLESGGRRMRLPDCAVVAFSA